MEESQSNVKIFKARIRSFNNGKANGENEFLYKTEIRSDGDLLIQSREYTPDRKLCEVITNSYDSSLRIIQELLQNHITEAECSILREYDESNNSYIEKELFGDEEEARREVSLDSSGKPLSIKIFEEGELHIEEEFQYENGSTTLHRINNHAESFIEETVYSYNAVNKISEEVYLENGQETGRILYHYDASGRLSEMKIHDEEEPPYRQEYTYDADGHPIGTTLFAEEVFAGAIRQDFDSEGRKISEEHVNEKEEITHGYKCQYTPEGKIAEEIYFDYHHPDDNYILRYEYG